MCRNLKGMRHKSQGTRQKAQGTRQKAEGTRQKANCPLQQRYVTSPYSLFPGPWSLVPVVTASRRHGITTSSTIHRASDRAAVAEAGHVDRMRAGPTSHDQPDVPGTGGD